MTAGEIRGRSDIQILLVRQQRRIKKGERKTDLVQQLIQLYIDLYMNNNNSSTRVFKVHYPLVVVNHERLLIEISLKLLGLKTKNLTFRWELKLFQPDNTNLNSRSLREVH